MGGFLLGLFLSVRREHARGQFSALPLRVADKTGANLPLSA